MHMLILAAPPPGREERRRALGMSADASSWQDLEGLGRPRVSDGHVAAFVAERFGLAVATITRLTGERDLNFRATTAEGRSYVVKVANAGESKDQLECEHAAMLHVAQHAARESEGSPTLATPMPVSLCDGDGATIASIVADDGKEPPAQYLVRVLTFIEGNMWSGSELAPDFLASLGRAAASLDVSLLSFSHPAAAREHAWDLGACQATVRGYLSDLEAEEERALVLHFAALHQSEVAPLLGTAARDRLASRPRRTSVAAPRERACPPPTRQQLAHLARRPGVCARAVPRSVVHQDLNDNNVVCDGAGRVSGVIDFGDMSLTETANNLAVALAYAFFGRPDPLAVLAQMVRGYVALRPLGEAELRCLFPLACMRVCTTVVMAAHSVKLDPENAEYLTISQKPAWEALKVLRTVDPPKAAATALEAGAPPVPAGGGGRGVSV